MRKKYKSAQLLEILHLCVWKCERKLDNHNLGHVSDQLGSDDYLGTNSNITKRYLTDLLKSVNEDEAVNLDAEMFGQVLSFLGFKDFSNFEYQQKKIGHYLDSSKIDLSDYKELKTALVFPTDENFSVQQYLKIPQHELQVKCELISNPEDDLVEVMNEIGNLKKEFPFIMWYITEYWKEQFDDFKYKAAISELLSSKQVIPIFIGDLVFSNSLISPNLKTELCISGMSSVFMGLFHVENESVKAINDAAEGSNSRKSEKIGVSVNGNVGEIYQGNKFKAKTMNFGSSPQNESTNN